MQLVYRYSPGAGRTSKHGLGRWAPFVVGEAPQNTKAQKKRGCGPVVRARLPVRTLSLPGAPAAATRAQLGEPAVGGGVFKSRMHLTRKLESSAWFQPLSPYKVKTWFYNLLFQNLLFKFFNSCRYAAGPGPPQTPTRAGGDVAAAAARRPVGRGDGAPAVGGLYKLRIRLHP
jgi:hypothetical protein